MFEPIYEQIRKYPRIILHRHKNPDGDALGSQFGLAQILRDTFPEKEILTVSLAVKSYITNCIAEAGEYRIVGVFRDEAHMGNNIINAENLREIRSVFKLRDAKLAHILGNDTECLWTFIEIPNHRTGPACPYSRNGNTVLFSKSLYLNGIFFIYNFHCPAGELAVIKTVFTKS